MAMTIKKPKSTKKIVNHLNIKTDDNVKVICGRDIGKTGRVLRTVPEKRRVVVEKINQVKKTQRPTQQNPQGGISTIEAPIDVSNVMLVCPNCNKPTRVGHRINDNGVKVRTCKKCGQDIDK